MTSAAWNGDSRSTATHPASTTHSKMTEAERLAATIDLRRLHMAYGNDNVVPSTEEALSHRDSAEERAYVEQQRARLIHGDAARVKDRLQQLSEEFGADELLAITITGDYASRLRSYQLLAEELL